MLAWLYGGSPACVVALLYVARVISLRRQAERLCGSRLGIRDYDPIFAQLRSDSFHAQLPRTFFPYTLFATNIKK